MEWKDAGSEPLKIDVNKLRDATPAAAPDTVEEENGQPKDLEGE